MSEKTQEQLDAEAAAAAQKQAEKEAKAAAAAEAKAAKDAEREAAKAAKEQAKLDAKAAKEAARQPEQNGIRRPGPDGLCGKVWTLADTLSASLGQAVPIANLLEAGVAQGLNPSNIRTEYARWKKFHGLTGRTTAPEAASE